MLVTREVVFHFNICFSSFLAAFPPVVFHLSDLHLFFFLFPLALTCCIILVFVFCIFHSCVRIRICTIEFSIWYDIFLSIKFSVLSYIFFVYSVFLF